MYPSMYVHCMFVFWTYPLATPPITHICACNRDHYSIEAVQLISVY